MHLRIRLPLLCLFITDNKSLKPINKCVLLTSFSTEITTDAGSRCTSCYAVQVESNSWRNNIKLWL